MARKLKTFVTSVGFFELAVAAPSMKAALDAWGANKNAFHQGFAGETDDTKIIAAATAKPGTVLKRAVGTKGEFRENAELPKILPAEAKRPELRKPQPQPKPKPKLQKHLSKAAEKAAIRSFEKAKARRDKEREKEEAERQRRPAKKNGAKRPLAKPRTIATGRWNVTKKSLPGSNEKDKAPKTRSRQSASAGKRKTKNTRLEFGRRENDPSGSNPASACRQCRQALPG
jgi:hypothetical protein